MQSNFIPIESKSKRYHSNMSTSSALRFSKEIEKPIVFQSLPLFHPSWEGDDIGKIKTQKKKKNEVDPFSLARKKAHIISEQKRRQSINEGFEELKKIVPSRNSTDSKAVILRKGNIYQYQITIHSCELYKNSTDPSNTVQISY